MPIIYEDNTHYTLFFSKSTSQAKYCNRSFKVETNSRKSYEYTGIQLNTQECNKSVFKYTRSVQLNTYVIRYRLEILVLFFSKQLISF